MSILRRKSPRIRAAAVTGIGLLREANEDNFYLDGVYMSPERAAACTRGLDEFSGGGEKTACLLGVFDGMGGEDCGEVASALSAEAAEGLKRVLRRRVFRSEEKLIEAFFRRTDALVAQRANAMGASCVGCTGAVLWLSGGRATAANLGDSRIYLLRGGELKQLSHDHTQSQRMVDIGMITREELELMPRSHAIWQFIGMSHIATHIPHPRILPSFRLREGDVFLLCSDGLTDMLDDETIAAIIAEHDDAPELARALAQAALDAGGFDNVTVLVALVGALPGEESPEAKPEGEGEGEGSGEDKPEAEQAEDAKEKGE